MRSAVLVCLLFVWGSAMAGIIGPDIIVARGDVNDSGSVNMSDAVYLNAFLFNGGPAPPCMNQADVNKDGHLDVSDSVYLLDWLYNGGPAPPAPGPNNTTCTTTSPYLSCSSGC